jgi:hypothetical protein
MALIGIGVFLARLWALAPTVEGPLEHGGSEVTSSFELKVHYHNRPPYYVKTAEGVVGLCATPVAQALKNAGINFLWTETPPKRQLHLLQQNPPDDCIIGWYKTREREQYARYSTTIYQDKAIVAIVRRADHRFPERCTVAQLMTLPDIIMLSRTGYSYGALVDKALAQIPPLRIDSGVDSSEWLSILYIRRADFLLIAQEEAEYLLSRTRLPRDAFRYLTLTDLPPGSRRYVLFSRAVPPEIVDRFNTAYRARASKTSVQIASGDRP